MASLDQLVARVSHLVWPAWPLLACLASDPCCDLASAAANNSPRRPQALNGGGQAPAQHAQHPQGRRQLDPSNPFSVLGSQSAMSLVDVQPDKQPAGTTTHAPASTSAPSSQGNTSMTAVS